MGSYGEDEDTCSTEQAGRINTEFMKAGARGISLLFASGDSGAAGDSHTCKNGKFVPQWPSGSPYVTAVGGTSGGGLAPPEELPHLVPHLRAGAHAVQGEGCHRLQGRLPRPRRAPPGEVAAEEDALPQWLPQLDHGEQDDQGGQAREEGRGHLLSAVRAAR